MSRAPVAEVRELRRQVREWRRGRADTTLTQVLSDAYITVFAVAMLGAMAISAILAAARAVGPVLVSPATGSWLLAAPVDRGAVLRPRLVWAGMLSAVSAGLLSAVISSLAGLDDSGVAVFTTAMVGGGMCAVMFAAVVQTRSSHNVRLLTWVLGTATWLGLVVVAAGAAPPAPRSPLQSGIAGIVAAVLIGLAAAALLVSAASGLADIHRSRLTPGGSLLASLSGALASLDLALTYDVAVARRWLLTSTVRPVRGGPSGVWALVWRDVIRLRRSAPSLVMFAGALVVPYIVITLDLGEIVALLGALTAFATGLGLFSALRTTSRNQGLLRCFPMSGVQVRMACLVVPAAVLVVWALGATPAIHEGLAPISWPDSVLVTTAMGFAAIASIARWLLAQPPDYSAPLVSSPAGAIPTGLPGSLLRGFDVLVLLTAPVLIAPSAVGAAVSLALAAVVVTVLIRRS